MQKRISTLPFKGTAEQKSKLDAVIAEHKSQPGAVMPVLQKAQDIYGYLPIEVQMMIADGLGPEECTSDGQFSLTACRCIGACGLAPVLTVNDDVYGRLLPKDIPDIIAKYRQ